jgi:glycosyltransferase involved in cell wall biosynthesis
MRILITSDLYWPVVNGISVFSRNLARGLASRGHEVMVIAPSQIGKKYKEVDDNYTVVRTASIIFPFYQNFRISLTPYSEVKKVIDKFKPDVIHVQVQMMIGHAAMRYGNKLGIPIVCTNHAMPENLMDNLKLLAPFARPISYMLKRYGLRFFSKADYVTTPTESAIKVFGLDSKLMGIPVEAVSNGINLSRFSVGAPSPDILKQFKLPTDRPIITFVGRVDAEKHLPVLLRAFKQVLSKAKAHLLIIGDGTDLNNLKQIAKETGISDQVTFTGMIVGDPLVKLHKVGTVFCMPSPAELQSIATLEAMASGQPVVAVDAGALKELCQDKRNGYLCKQDDEKEIAKGLIKIISDSKLRKSMSKESVSIAATHDIKKTLERFEEIYIGVINS